MKHIIAITGEMRAGKDTFVGILQHILSPLYQVQRISFRDGLVEFCKDMGWDENDRTLLQNLFKSLEKNFGDVLLMRVMDEIKGSQAQFVIVETVRMQNQYITLLLLAKQSDWKFTLVGLTAPEHLRFERAKASKQKTGEVHYTLEDFRKAHQAVTEIHIPSILNQANFKIVNDSDLASLEHQAREFCNEFNIPLPKTQG